MTHKRRFGKRTLAYLAFMMTVVLVSGFFAGCAADGKDTVRVDFSSEDGWLEIIRISVTGKRPRFENAGRAAIKDSVIMDIDVEFPAYPWEKTGSVEEYREHAWLKFDGSMEQVGEEGRTPQGLLAYDGQYFLVAEDNGTQYVYGVGEGSTISGLTLDAFIDRIIRKQSSAASGGTL